MKKENNENVVSINSNLKSTSKRNVVLGNKTSGINLSSNFVRNYGIVTSSITPIKSIHTYTLCYNIPTKQTKSFSIVKAETNIKGHKDNIIISIPTKSTSRPRVLKKTTDYKVALKFLHSFTEEDFTNFMQELQNFPFFAYKNQIGKKIYNTLKEYINKNTLTIHKGTKFYRCREWDKNQSSHFTPDTMWNPPARKPTQHRFNTAGVSYLYVGNSPTIAKKESGITGKNKFTTVEMKLKEDVKVLDLSSDNSIIFNKCKIPNTNKEYDTYLFPNFIASCLDYMRTNESVDIDGIKYLSTKNKAGENFYNVVFFDKGKSNFVNVKVIPNT